MPGCEPAGSSRSDADPREVAGYRLLRRIGEGGMSTVYLSYDVGTDRPVAVKVLADHLAHAREFVERFYREARLSRLLAHPHLVRGLGAGFDPGVGKHYLILEFIDGPTAQTALTRVGRFPIGSAVQVGIDIARALAFLHARQYVHRDVKPDNILLHPDGCAKLADLGVAKRLSDESHLTSLNQGVGTPYYMAYEQALNANLVDGRSDVFALGATLYHLLAGEVPFPGVTHEEVVRGKERDRFRPLPVVNPAVPTALAEIIATSLARDPRARFDSACTFADALEETGLATRIPVFSSTGDAGDTDCPAGPSEAPTRADLAAFVRSDAPDAPGDPLPPHPPVVPPTEAFPTDSTPPPKDFPGGSHTRQFRIVSGALVGLGLLGAILGGLSARRVPPTAPVAQPLVTAAKVESGLSRSVPQ